MPSSRSNGGWVGSAAPWRRRGAALLLLLLSFSFLLPAGEGAEGIAGRAAPLLRGAFVLLSLALAATSLRPPPPARAGTGGGGGEGDPPAAGDPSHHESRNRDLLAHHRCTKRMLRSRTGGAVFQELLEGIRDGLGYTGAVMAFLDHEGNLVFPPAPEGDAPGFPGHTAPASGSDGSFFHSLLAGTEPVLFDGPPPGSAAEYRQVCGEGSSIVVPLLHRGWAGDHGGEEDPPADPPGDAPRFRPALVVLRGSAGGRVLDRDTVPTVLSLLNEAEVALEMADMFGRLRALSVTDGLTGLLNHREFYLRLDREVERARRYGHSLSLLILDVDDFKRYNDRFGHPAGDEALRILASLLRQSARGTDIVARYGGEEFAVILPEGSSSGALQMAERVRSSLASANFDRVPDGQVHLTVSIGIYTSERGESSADTIVAMADDAAYRAKAEGKNRVIVRAGN